MYKNLEQIRKRKRLSIKDMAKVISKSPANYYKKEIGKVSITLKEAILISKFLEEEIEILFEES